MQTRECVSTSKDQTRCVSEWMKWPGSRVFMSLCVCLRVRPWEEMTAGGTQGVPASSRERPERSWGLGGVSRGESCWCLCVS